jgi:hypothetical protein
MGDPKVMGIFRNEEIIFCSSAKFAEMVCMTEPDFSSLFAKCFK